MGAGAAGSGWIPFGRVARPHGVRGELRVAPYQAGDALPPRLGRVRLSDPDHRRSRVVEVVSVRPASGAVLMRLAGIDSRDAAEPLRRWEVAVSIEDLPALEPGEFYLHELIGASVRDEQGAPLGVLEGFLNRPTPDGIVQDLATVRTDQGVQLLPIVEDTIVHFDRDAHVVTVARARVEGLL